MGEPGRGLGRGGIVAIVAALLAAGSLTLGAFNATGLITASAGLHVAEDQSITFGTSDVGEVAKDGNDELSLSGIPVTVEVGAGAFSFRDGDVLALRGDAASTVAAFAAAEDTAGKAWTWRGQTGGAGSADTSGAAGGTHYYELTGGGAGGAHTSNDPDGGAAGDFVWRFGAGGAAGAGGSGSAGRTSRMYFGVAGDTGTGSAIYLEAVDVGAKAELRITRENGATALVGGGHAIMKASDTTIDDNPVGTTMTTDPELAGWALEANAKYIVEAHLLVTLLSGSPDFKCQFTGPASPTKVIFNAFWESINGAGATAANSAPLTAFSSQLSINCSAATTVRGRINGIIINGANAGTMNFQWAQLNSFAENVVLESGSWIRVTKVE